MANRILAETLHKALVEAGIIDKGDYVRRIVIDAEYGEAVHLYLERFGDERLLGVVLGLNGIEVTTGTPARAADPGHAEGCAGCVAADQAGA